MDNVSNEGSKSGNNSGQQGGNEAKDSSQQIRNEAHDFDHKGKNAFLDCSGNDSEETFEEEEDNLMGGLGQ